MIFANGAGSANVLSDLFGGRSILRSFDPVAAAARGKIAAARNAIAEAARRAARRANHGRERRAGFHRQFLDRDCRAARHIETDHRQAQSRHQCRAQRFGDASQAETARGPGHVRNAGRLCRFPCQRTAEMDRDGKALGRGGGVNQR